MQSVFFKCYVAVYMFFYALLFFTVSLNEWYYKKLLEISFFKKFLPTYTGRSTYWYLYTKMFSASCLIGVYVAIRIMLSLICYRLEQHVGIA